MLIATTEGLFQCVSGQVRAIPNSHVAFLDVSSIYQDPQERLYLGTQGQGLWLVDGEQVTNFTTRQGLLDDEISGLLVDNEDRIWMASGGGLSYTPRLDLVNFAADKVSQVTTLPFRLTDATRSFEVQEGVQPCILKSTDGGSAIDDPRPDHGRPGAIDSRFAADAGRDREGDRQRPGGDRQVAVVAPRILEPGFRVHGAQPSCADADHISL